MSSAISAFNWRTGEPSVFMDDGRFTWAAKNFDSDGYGFLLKFARKTKGQPFPAEAVTLAAEAAGIVSSDRRHWGRVFVQAARDGYIARCDTPFRRVMGDGTLTLGWVAL